MRLGIFAKTFDTVGAREHAGGGGRRRAMRPRSSTWPASACLRCRTRIDPGAAAEIGAAAPRATGVAIAAVSGTYNMIHPDPAVRRTGLRQA